MYGDMSPKELGKRLWGDAWVDPNTRAFRKGFPPPDCQRTFVQFILEPMYKIYSQVMWVMAYMSSSVKAIDVMHGRAGAGRAGPPLEDMTRGGTLWTGQAMVFCMYA